MELFGEHGRPPERRTEGCIRFVCEQDGLPERDLKAALIPELRRSGSVQRAYLARVQYGDDNPMDVALCIRGPEDPELVRRVCARFAELFNTEVYLDILFLSDIQEDELARICKSFYGAPYAACAPPRANPGQR
jgi:hypothetical protein